MKKSHGFLPKILAGKKTIESRWYEHRAAPWNKIRTGDSVYFKDSGEPITVKAQVKDVLQFEDLTPQKTAEIVQEYGQPIGVTKDETESFCAKRQTKRYCILIFLENVEAIEPFEISKKGFGNMTAWMATDDIQTIKLSSNHLVQPPLFKRKVNDELFMTEAIREAEIALNNGDWPIGCIIILDNTIIAHGHNQVYSTNSDLAHAEMVALHAAQEKLYLSKSRGTLYTTVEPCPMCFGAILMSGIERIVYGIKDNLAGATHFLDHLPTHFHQEKYNIRLTEGILANKCLEVFKKGKPTQGLIRKGLLERHYQ